MAVMIKTVAHQIIQYVGSVAGWGWNSHGERSLLYVF